MNETTRATIPVAVGTLMLVGMAACGGSEQPPPASPSPGSGQEAPPTAAQPVATIAGSSGSTDSAGGGQGPLEMNMECRKKARDVPGASGSKVLASCAGGCEVGGSVWGTDVYTDDSAVCPALIHAGAIPKTGGRALVTFVDGLRAYVGSERNGIRTRDYEKWRRSFYVQAIDPSGNPTTPAPQVTDENTARLSCTHRATLADDTPGASLRIICPAGCTSGSVWGTDIYTRDSRICVAAVHAGVIPAGGGEATLTVAEGKPAYKGTTRNGVTTKSYGKYGMSFVLKR